jgi:hypothetical protein
VINFDPDNTVNIVKYTCLFRDIVVDMGELSEELSRDFELREAVTTQHTLPVRFKQHFFSLVGSVTHVWNRR